MAKKRTRTAGTRLPIAAIIPPLVKPIVEPVVKRLDRHEQLLLEMKSALGVQFTRIADMQAQLDLLIADHRKGPKRPLDD